MNHMHAGEWERAPGRTFTYNIQHTLICLFITGGGGDVVPLSISNLFDIDAGFIILVWTPIF